MIPDVILQHSFYRFLETLNKSESVALITTRSHISGTLRAIGDIFRDGSCDGIRVISALFILTAEIYQLGIQCEKLNFVLPPIQKHTVMNHCDGISSSKSRNHQSMLQLPSPKSPRSPSLTTLPSLKSQIYNEETSYRINSKSEPPQFMKSWLLNNQHYPSPKSRENDEMAVKTGIKQKPDFRYIGHRSEANYVLDSSWKDSATRGCGNTINSNHEPTSPLNSQLSIHSSTSSSTPKRVNYSPEVQSILKSWLFEHRSKPYPTPSEKHRLASETGLSICQINYWMINGRRRLLKEKKTELNTKVSVIE